MPHRVTDVDIHQVVSEIWASILGLALLPAPDGNGAMPGGSVTGSIHITGAAACTVSVECSNDLAARATALMLGMDDAPPTRDDIEDAMGELANMTGGGVKALLTGSCQLSLPTVVDGRDYRFHVPGAVEIRSVRFTCEDQPLAVRVFTGRSRGRD